MTRAFRSTIAAVALAGLAGVAVAGAQTQGYEPASHAAGARPSSAHRHDVRLIRIRYRANTGVGRFAYVLVPSWYRPGRNRPIPLVISPHGRGVTGLGNARTWGDLPGVGGFAVVSPDGQGRRLPRYSWGYAGQIDDLAAMPSIVRKALPWFRVDRRRIYAFGGSMGGQEALLVAARYPRLLAGVAAFDAVADLAMQYRRFPLLGCNRRCRHNWVGPLGRGLQKLARLEVGDSPRRAPGAFARRSPLTYARRLAFSGVPVQLWWSTRDRIVTNQEQQSGRLAQRLESMNPEAPVREIVGEWAHSAEMQAGARLPLALAIFRLLPRSVGPAQRANHAPAWLAARR